MITKIAAGILGTVLQGAKAGLVDGGLIGGLHAFMMSDEEKERVRKEHNLAPDDSIYLRSILQGALTGGLAGAAIKPLAKGMEAYNAYRSADAMSKIESNPELAKKLSRIGLEDLAVKGIANFAPSIVSGMNAY